MKANPAAPVAEPQQPRDCCSHELPAKKSSPKNGYGECSVNGCPCRAYKDSYGSELCNNCGHKYTDHW